MKRFIILTLLLCLVLCGCAESVPEMTTEPTTPSQTEPAEVTPPTGCYDPDNEITALTSGAVQVFAPQMEEITGFLAMGSDVFLFSGRENTIITKLSGAELSNTAMYTTGCAVLADDPSVNLSGKGLSYYDNVKREIVFLDTALREVSRVKLPEDITGSPVLSADRKTTYYCTAEGIRAMELEEGISRLIKQMSNENLSIRKLLMEDTILTCVVQSEQTTKILFVSTQTGETIRQINEDMFVSTCGSDYYAVVSEGAMQAMIYGNGGNDQMLIPADLWPQARWYFESNHAALTRSFDGRLDYYDLSGGKRTASLMMEDFNVLTVAEGEENVIYILGQYHNQTLICAWNVSESVTEDDTVYTSRRYTVSDPDTQGLKECQELAAQIGQKYNIEVLVGNDATAVKSAEYLLETEYQVPMIRQELEKLDAWLAAFPEKFLATAAKGTTSGIVRICLVRSVSGTPESGNPPQMDGACFWIDENVYAAIPVGFTTEKTFYHTIFHVLETRIMSKSKYCYDWESHNPEEFAYDYQYGIYHDPSDMQYLEGENRAFIDHFSMTFPREDRATIMAYAMTEWNAEYFQSEIMQNKLIAICRGIRKAFGYEKSAEIFIWEQYLNEPLAKQ